MGYSEVYVVEVKADFSKPIHVMAHDREDAERHVLKTFAGDYKVVGGMNSQSYDFDQFSIQMITKRDDQEASSDAVTSSEVMQVDGADDDSIDEPVKMNFADKAAILSSLYSHYREEMEGNPAWREYLTRHDILLRLAYVYDYEIVEGEPSTVVMAWMEHAWDDFCELLSIDPNSRYGSVMECVEASDTQQGSDDREHAEPTGESSVEIWETIQDFITRHDGTHDAVSPGGFSTCSHFGPWIAGFDNPSVDFANTSDQETANSKEDQNSIQNIGHLLEHADLPDGWAAACSWSLNPTVSTDFQRIITCALYGEIDSRVFTNPPRTVQEALALTYLVEATVWQEAAWMAPAGNYIPMGDVHQWWPRYMSIVDRFLTRQDLQQLSETAGGCTYTESMSSLTPPDRLIEIYQEFAPTFGVTANQHLPSEFVNENMETDVDLLFHPNADPDHAWEIVQALLEDREIDDLMNAIYEFDNMREGNWFHFSGFATHSPQAAAMHQRIRQWCSDNIEDDDERSELLEELYCEV